LAIPPRISRVLLTINKERHYLWRAVDQDGNVLDILVQRRRDKKAAKKFFHIPSDLVADQQASDSENSSSLDFLLLHNREASFVA
jgi:transposase-like protein